MAKRIKFTTDQKKKYRQLSRPSYRSGSTRSQHVARDVVNLERNLQWNSTRSLGCNHKEAKPTSIWFKTAMMTIPTVGIAFLTWTSGSPRDTAKTSTPSSIPVRVDPFTGRANALVLGNRWCAWWPRNHHCFKISCADWGVSCRIFFLRSGNRQVRLTLFLPVWAQPPFDQTVLGATSMPAFKSTSRCGGLLGVKSL